MLEILEIYYMSLLPNRNNWIFPGPSRSLVWELTQAYHRNSSFYTLFPLVGMGGQGDIVLLDCCWIVPNIKKNSWQDLINIIFLCLSVTICSIVMPPHIYTFLVSFLR